MGDKNDVVSEEIALYLLKKQQEDCDRETAHIEADKILCEFLEGIGYSEIVKEWNKINKWYA